MKRQMVRFLVVGVANALVGLTVIFAAKALLAFGDVAANATGYGVGLTVSFVLNKSWTFNHKGEILASAVRFLGVFAVAYTINLTIVLALIDWAQVNAYLAHALGMPCYTVAFFLLSKHFAFRGSDTAGRRADSADGAQR